MKVKEIMSLNPIYASVDNTVCNIVDLMSKNHIGVIPVCDNDKRVVGVITDRDIILRSVACDKNLKSTPITDIMTTNTITANSDWDVADVSKLMKNNQIRRVPVIENDQLVGIVSIGDLARERKISGKEVSDTLECICEQEGKIEHAD